MKILRQNNPIFVLMLGLCSSLAITTKVENAYLMGLSVFIVLFSSELIAALIKKYVNENVKIPVYIVVIATFVTILEIVLHKYVLPLYNALSIYLPLIVVNCIVLGRVLSVASKSDVKTSIKDSINVSLGYTFALILIALFREVLGNNTITLIDSLSSITNFKLVIKVLPNTTLLPMPFLLTPGGAFIVLGILMAFIGGKHESN